jgi:radical SAM protein with 4Fe4S-binding SPASM domain
VRPGGELNSPAQARNPDILLPTHRREGIGDCRLVDTRQPGTSPDQARLRKSYADLALGLYRRLGNRRLPIQGTIDLTWRCNLACPHCYNRLPLHDRSALRTELTYEEHCRILDEISDAGCLWLLLTGGEIFVRKDFRRIYTYAKQKGLLITLFTNGTLITPDLADFLKEWPPFSIEITLYGRTRMTYERVTAVPGSYGRCMNGIRLLMERKLPLSLKTLLLTTNSHELGPMQAFVEQELGLPYRFDAMVNPCIDCSPQPLAFRLDPRQSVELDLRDERRSMEWREFVDRHSSQLSQSGDGLYECGAGTKTFAINPRGGLSLCAFAGVEGYDLRTGTFKEGWEGPVLTERSRKITRPTRCVRCAIKAACGMCPAYGRLENRDAEEPVDFLCASAHLRSTALGIPVPPHGDCPYCPGGMRHAELMASAERISRTSQPLLAQETCIDA